MSERESIGYCERCGVLDHHLIRGLCLGCTEEVETVGDLHQAGCDVDEALGDEPAVPFLLLEQAG